MAGSGSSCTTRLGSGANIIAVVGANVTSAVIIIQDRTVHTISSRPNNTDRCHRDPYLCKAELLDLCSSPPSLPLPSCRRGGMVPLPCSGSSAAIGPPMDPKPPHAQTGEANAQRTRMKMKMTCGAGMLVRVDCDPERDGSFPCAPNRSRVEIDQQSGINEDRV